MAVIHTGAAREALDDTAICVSCSTLIYSVATLRILAGLVLRDIIRGSKACGLVYSTKFLT